MTRVPRVAVRRDTPGSLHRLMLFALFDLVEPSTRPLELTKSTCWPSTKPLELTKSTCWPETRPLQLTKSTGWPETRPPELTRSTLVGRQDDFLG